MCLRYDGDDGESKATAATAPRGIGMAEAFERTWQELGREAGAFVENVQFELVMPAYCS